MSQNDDADGTFCPCPFGKFFQLARHFTHHRFDYSRNSPPPDPPAPFPPPRVIKSAKNVSNKSITHHLTFTVPEIPTEMGCSAERSASILRTATSLSGSYPYRIKSGGGSLRKKPTPCVSKALWSERMVDEILPLPLWVRIFVAPQQREQKINAK